MSFLKTQKWGFEYESQTGNITRETDPLGRTSTYTYAPNGIDLLEVRRVNGQSTDLISSTTYNSQHQPLTITDATGQTTTYTYLPDGRVQTVVSPPRAGLTVAQRTTTYSYYSDNAPTGAGRVQTVTGPSTSQGSPVTTYTYDAYGRVRTETDSGGYTLTFDYDALDRQTKVTYPDGTYEETVYNRLDAEKRRDRLGRWTHTFHDALRRVVSTRDPAGRTTTQQWCSCGSLDKLIDANGNATTWERDLQGRVTREVRPNGSAKEFTYETTTSRLKKVKDAKNQETQFSYHLDNKVQQISYVNAQVSTPNVSFTYDSVEGRLATLTDGEGTTSYTYNPITSPPSLGADRLASADGPLSNDTITYGYDELGRDVSRTLNGVTTTWVYDELGRLTTLGDPIGNFTYAYLGTTGRTSSATYPNGQTTTYSYYPVSGDQRLQEMHNKTPGGATLSRFTSAYDAVGNITNWTQQTDSDPAKAYDFGYDTADEITSAVYRTTDPTPVILKRYGYAYDPAGNRTAEQIDDAVTGATHDNMNRLVSQQPGGALLFKGTTNEAATVTVGGKPATTTPSNVFTATAPVPSGTSTVQVQATDPSGNVRTNTYQVSQTGTGKTFAYDANGNLMSDGTRTFEYDAEDRLVAVVSGTHRSEFTYNGLSHRVRMVEKDGGAVVSDSRFVWCGLALCEERDGGSGTVTRRYAASAMVEGGQSYFYTRGPLGSMAELTDSSGTVRARYSYDPWGRTTKVSGDKDASFGFTGQYMHGPSGLALAPFRAYDPGLGRWINEDPLTKGGFSLGLRSYWLARYSYVDNNPIARTDSLGLATDCTNACAKAKQMGLDGGDAGGVICCDSVKFACSWQQFPPSVPANAQQIIAACNVVHEQDHFDDVKCPCSPGISRPGFNKGANKKKEECAAYRAGLACDIARQQNCGGDPACLKAVQDDIEILLRQIKVYCGK